MSLFSLDELLGEDRKGKEERWMTSFCCACIPRPAHPHGRSLWYPQRNKEDQYPVGPIVLGILIFVVCGSGE